MVAYELWDTETGNLMGSYPTEVQALLVYTKSVQQFGWLTLSGVALVLEDGDTPITLAIGRELLDRAIARFPGEVRDPREDDEDEPVEHPATA